MEIINESIGFVCNTFIKIQYKHLTKYYIECNLQGHNIENCRYLHPELKPPVRDQGSESSDRGKSP